MPILNSEIRSYNIIFTGKKERLIQSLQENNLTQYIFLNDLLMVLYVEANFNENIFNNINQIVWWERSYAMSSLINITNNLLQGVPVRQATDMTYMGNNYIYGTRKVIINLLQKVCYLVVNLLEMK